MTSRQFQQNLERMLITANAEFEYNLKLTSAQLFEYINKAQDKIAEAIINGTEKYQGLHDLVHKLLSTVVPSSVSEPTTHFGKRYASGALGTTFYKILGVACKLNCDYAHPAKVKDYFSKVTATLIHPSQVGLYNIPADDAARIIPQPVAWIGTAVIDENIETVVYLQCDRYTEIAGVEVFMIRKPHDISITTQCELPADVHKDIVELAFQLIIQQGVGTFNQQKS